MTIFQSAWSEHTNLTRRPYRHPDEGWWEFYVDGNLFDQIETFEEAWAEFERLTDLPQSYQETAA